VLNEKDFPRWVFRPGESNKLVKSLDEYEQAMGGGWFSTVGEATEAKATDIPLISPDAHEADSEDAPPTREELEAKATELGIEFSARIGDKKLAERIEAVLNQGT
jgi:hypothetical protein